MAVWGLSTSKGAKMVYMGICTTRNGGLVKTEEKHLNRRKSAPYYRVKSQSRICAGVVKHLQNHK